MLICQGEFLFNDNMKDIDFAFDKSSHENLRFSVFPKLGRNFIEFGEFSNLENSNVLHLGTHNYASYSCKMSTLKYWKTQSIITSNYR